MKSFQLAVPAFLFVLIGCSDKPGEAPLPEVSIENCSMEKIKAIEPKARREQFAALCSRMPRISKTPNPVNWFEEFAK